MKATLTFNLPEEQEEFKLATKGSEAHGAIHEIGQEVFRPARKHGYPDHKIQALITRLDDLARKAAGYVDSEETSTVMEEYEGATELVSLLEQKFYEIINAYNLEL